MAHDAFLWLIFAAFFGAPIALAVLVALTNRLFATAVAKARPSPGEARAIIEYARRRMRCLGVVAAGLVAAVAAWFAFGLPLTAVALLTGAAAYGLLVHLRCPLCETTASTRGLAVAGHCYRCGGRLRA